MRSVLLALAVSGMFFAVGCGSKTKTGEVHTVDWYKIHPEERKAMIDKVRSNPGEFENDPNGVNANRAQQELTWSSRGGIKAAPLTSEQLRKKP